VLGTIILNFMLCLKPITGVLPRSTAMIDSFEVLRR